MKVLVVAVFAGFAMAVLAQEPQSNALPSAVPAQSDAHGPESQNDAMPGKSEEPASVAADRFDILEYRIAGNTRLAPMLLEAAVLPHLGPGRTADDVEAARIALEKAYRDAGYLTVLVDTPEQKVENGVVVLQVNEAKVDCLRITGARYYSLARIRAQVPTLNEGAVPNFTEVQPQIAVLGRSADRRVTPVLKPSSIPGKVDVELKVNDKLPLHGLLEVNNYHSANTTSTRVTGAVRYDNLWQREHSVSVQYQTAPENPDDTQVWSLSYVFPNLSNGNIYVLYGVRSRSRIAVAGEGSDITVRGNVDMLGMRRVIPLTPAENVFHSLTLGADYKSFKENLTIGSTDTFGTDTNINTPISYLPFVVQYSRTRTRNLGLSQWGIAANFSVRGLADDRIDCGNNDIQNEFTCKRFGARPNYFYLKAEARRKREFSKGRSATFDFEAQLSDQPLISAEQFGAGGVQSGTVRGYLESEAFGDQGARLSFEWHEKPISVRSDSVSNLHFVAFAEGASLRVQDALPEQQAHADIAGAGIGLRLTAFSCFRSAIDLAWPLRDTRNTQAGEPRLHAKIACEF